MVRRLSVLVVALAAIVTPAFAQTDGFDTAACSTPGVMPGSGEVHTVSPDGSGMHTTIQEAVDDAESGDTILVYPGTYNEAVRVRTPALRIRGTDRNAVVLDGSSTLEIGINVTGVDNTVIENMTAHNYVRHGFYWRHVSGYWGRYLTAYNNGLYGIYAFGARCGQFDHSYTSGNADSGFYIGECYPCDAVITDILAENNALGYSGTNAGGNLTLRDSIWRNNALAIVPNTLDGEDRPPQRGATIRNNLVEDNNNITAPGVGLAGTYWGGGIIVAGGQSNAIYGNVVKGHALGGIVLSPLPDQNLWVPVANTMWGNVVTHDAAKYPDSIDLAQAAVSGPNNCWSDNVAATTAPPMLQEVWACGSMGTPPGGDPRVENSLIQGAIGRNGRAPSDWRTYPAPSAQGLQPDDDGDGSYANDGAVDGWLPALGL